MFDTETIDVIKIALLITWTIVNIFFIGLKSYNIRFLHMMSQGVVQAVEHATKFEVYSKVQHLPI
jgi:hypothetical protein